MPLVPNNAMAREPKDFGSIPLKPGLDVYIRDAIKRVAAGDSGLGVSPHDLLEDDDSGQPRCRRVRSSENLLAAQKAGSGAVQGVFAPNESTTFGMLLALRKASLAGKVHFVGFDASEKLVKGLQDGVIDALVVQNPFSMGDLAVHAIVDHLQGRPPEKRIDTGVRVVTKGDLEDPAVKALLHPDLKKWLGE